MKIRYGFVSNSSSSSFVLPLHGLKLSELNKIKNHIYFGRKLRLGYVDDRDAWNIEVRNGYVYGYTSMTNFDMSYFFDILDIKGAEWAEFDPPEKKCKENCNECKFRYLCLTE